MVYGVGCSGNMSNTLKTYGWHSLHGRAVPTAIGAKLANKDLTVIVAGGDGDGYGEGLNHFIHGLRGNVDITYLVHDNQVYGLTTGQNSPTSAQGTVSKSNPLGVIDQAMNPLAMALAAGGGFIGRGFVGYAEHLTQLIMEAIQYKGFSFVDIFQPCVTYNKVNTYQYFYDRLYQIDSSYTVDDKVAAWAKAWEWGEKIPYGIIYRDETKHDYTSELRYLPNAPLAQVISKPRDVTRLMKDFM
jgi:2-oxoglutarate ferredoxin oxidoreductase subunit beta